MRTNTTLKTKATSILLAIVMLLGMLPMSVFAAEGDTFEDDGLTYTVLSEDGSTGTVSLTGGINASGDISIPATVTKDSFTYTVTTIGGRAFDECTELTSITIPDTVTTIGDDAFYGCTGLTAINIPSNVKNIGGGAFNGCTNLASVNISDGVQEIRNGAFYGCTALTSITIPDSVNLIGSAAFQGCTGLTSVTIPSGVRTISSDAFNGCTGLTSVTISDGVTQIGMWTFANCTSLTSITIPDSVTKIYNSAFSGCTALTNIYYEGTAEEWAAISIGEGAIPDDVTIHTTNPELTITGGTEGTDYTYENGVLDIKTAGTYEIKNADSTTATSDIIKVSAPEGTVNITLGGVNIVTTEGMSVPAFEITGGCTTNITLADNTKNILNSYESKEGYFRYYAGLQNGEHPLTISCEHSEEAEHSCDNTCGSLEAVGGNHAACIGGGYKMHGNNITISGGNIVAISQGNGCIGGGNGGNGNNITISGGTVIATSTNGAGIGGGNGGNGSNITISGGIVTATSASGTGIGGGNGGNGSNITISGGIVTATGGDAGIGGDDQGSCSNVTISGGVVTATSTHGGGIGGGANSGIAENIKIAPAANTEIKVNTGANVSEAEELTYAFAKEADITELVSGNAYFHSETTEHNHADTNKDHVCDNDCAEFIGTCGDVDKDHDCDYGCNKYYGTHGDTNLDHNCDYGCAESIGTHEDSNTDTDHLCDYGCGATLENCTDAVNDDNHSCDVCGKADVSEHTYGNAVCEAPATCSECGATTGDALGHKDENTDHTCDRGCGKTDMGTHADSTTDTDHLCDYGCGATLENCTDAENDNNHSCDICGKADVSTHTYGDAACEAPATCSECGATTGDALGHKDDNTDHTCDRGCGKTDMGTHAQATGKHTCDYCDAVMSSCKDDDENHICDICGAELTHDYSTEWKSDGTYHWHECSCGAKTDEAAHNGGTATCTEKAKCVVCAEEYGELAAHTYEKGKCTVCEAVDPNYVPESSSPQTGDNSNMALWIALLLLSGGAVITLTVYDKKRRNTVKH